MTWNNGWKHFFQRLFVLISKAHSQACSQKFAMVGLFRRCKTKLKRFSFGIGTVLCPNLSEDPKKKVFTQIWNDFVPEITWRVEDPPKKGLYPCWNWFLRPNSLQTQSQNSRILIANTGRGAIFAFCAKIGLKIAKNVVFCIPMEVTAPFPPWLRYWTLEI